MSEFSDSVHFYNTDAKTIRAALAQRNIKAFILNEEGNPVSVLIDWIDREKVRDLGPVLDFNYAEDHGLWCKFYANGELIARANIAWGDDFGLKEPAGSPNEAGLSGDFTDQLVKHEIISAEAAEKIKKLFREYDPDDIDNPEKTVDEAAACLNLKHYRWLRCEDMTYNMEDLKELNPTGEVG